MILNFETSPFTPFELLVGKSLAEGKRVLGGGRQAADALVLWLRQGGRCFYCDDPMVAQDRCAGQPTNPRSVTIDHLFTRSNGGREGPKVQACYECNTSRGDMPAHEFIMVIARRQGLIANVQPQME